MAGTMRLTTHNPGSENTALRVGARVSHIYLDTGLVEALSPLKVLERGYSLTRAADGRVIAGVDDVAAGEQVTITLRDGELDTRVEGKSKKGKE